MVTVLFADESCGIMRRIEPVQHVVQAIWAGIAKLTLQVAAMSEHRIENESPPPPRPVAEIRSEFEAALKKGERPRIEQYVARSPELHRSSVIRELVALDMQYRRQSGEQPKFAEYFARFPELSELHTAHGTGDDASTMPQPSADPEEPAPRQLGRYEVRELLGQGGFGSVYSRGIRN